ARRGGWGPSPPPAAGAGGRRPGGARRWGSSAPPRSWSGRRCSSATTGSSRPWTGRRAEARVAARAEGPPRVTRYIAPVRLRAVALVVASLFQLIPDRSAHACAPAPRQGEQVRLDGA